MAVMPTVSPEIVVLNVAIAALSAPDKVVTLVTLRLTLAPGVRPCLIASSALACSWVQSACAVAASGAWTTMTMNTFAVWAPYPHDLAPPDVVPSLPAANVTPAMDEARDLHLLQRRQPRAHEVWRPLAAGLAQGVVEQAAQERL